MTNLDLEREMRKVLMDLEMTSCGVTPNPDGNGGGAFSSQPPKSGDGDPPHILYRRQWNEAIGETARRGVLERARDELDAIRRSRAGQGSETAEERTERLLSTGEGFRPGEVGLRFGLSETQVRRTRLRHGRDPEKGRVDPMQPMPPAPPSERMARALLLYREHGMSYREIGIVLSVSHETIRRDIVAATAAGGRKAA